MARFGRGQAFRPRHERPDLGPVYFDNSTVSPYSAALSTYNWQHVVGANANRYVVVGVSIFASGSVTSITVGGLSLTFLRADTSGVYRSELWYGLAPDTGSQTVTVNLSTSLTSIATATTYWNVNQAAPDANAGNTGTNTPATGAVTPVANNTRVFGVLSTMTASGTSDAIGQAPRGVNQGALGTGRGAEEGTVVSPASTTLQWDGIGAVDAWAVSVLALKPPANIIQQALESSLSFAGALTKSSSRGLTGALNFVGALAKRTIRPFTAAVNFAGNLAKRTGKTLPGAVSFAGNLVKTTSKALTGVVSFAGTLVKRTSRALTGALSFAGALTASRTFNMALTASLSFAGSLAKQTGKALPGVLSFTGSLTKAVSKGLASSLSFVGSLAKSTSRALTGAVSFVGNLVGTYIPAGGILYQQALASTLSFVGTLTKQTSRTHTGAVSFVGTLAKRTSKVLTAAVSFVGALAKRTGKALAGAVSFAGSLAKRTGKALASAVSFVGSLAKRTSRALTAALSFVGSLATTRIFNIAFTATLSFAGNLATVYIPFAVGAAKEWILRFRRRGRR